MKTKFYKKEKKLSVGFAMVEILVAVAIISASLLSALLISSKAISVSRQSVHVAQASFLLEEGAEAVRVMRDNAWTNISGLTPGTTYYPTFSGGTWTLSTNSSQVGIFTRKVFIGAVNRDAGTADISVNGTNDPGTKLITVNVSWQEGGVTVSKNLKFYISNIFP